MSVEKPKNTKTKPAKAKTQAAQACESLSQKCPKKVPPPKPCESLHVDDERELFFRVLHSARTAVCQTHFAKRPMAIVKGNLKHLSSCSPMGLCVFQSVRRESAHIYPVVESAGHLARAWETPQLPHKIRGLAHFPMSFKLECSSGQQLVLTAADLSYKDNGVPNLTTPWPPREARR